MTTDPFCTTHSAMIYDRGGMRRIGEVARLSSITWSRDRDGVSEASIRIEGASCSSQRDMIRRIASKRHELVIFRGDERVWEGPIFRISDEGWSIGIFAKDVVSYLFGTAMSRAWDNRANSTTGPTAMTTRLATIISTELTTSRTGRALGGAIVPIPAWESLDPPVNILPYLTVHNFPNEAQTAAYTLPFEMTVGEHLAGAARSSGIDYTAVGRAIHLWDVSRSIGRTRTLTEADFFGDVVITEYGADHTQIAYVMGQEGAHGEAVNPAGMDFYGPWTSVYNAYNEEGTVAPTQGELNSQAARNTSGRSPAPVEVRVPDNSQIRLSETLRITDLVPGVQVPLLATLNARAQDQLQKLDHLNVSETGEEGEKIQITLTPATKPDSDVETP